jgi:hypothetical protein
MWAVLLPPGVNPIAVKYISYHIKSYINLHSVDVFGLHLPCSSHAVPLSATNMPFWKRPPNATAGSRKGNGMRTAWYVWISIGRPETACGRPARVRLLPATTSSSRKFVIRSIPILDTGGQCETKQSFSWRCHCFRFFAFLLLQEVKIHKQWSHPPHNHPYIPL